MFGTFLRLERNRARLESRVVATELGLTETYYRLIESGRATLNQSLVFRLISLLESHRAHSGELPAQIHFERLAIYLVGAQWVSAEITAHRNVKDANLLAVEALASHSADFQRFHLRTQRYYSLREGEEAQRRFLEETAADAVGEFLGNIEYARPSTEAMFQDAIPAAELLDLPTLNVEMVTRLLEDLKGRRFVHTRQLASEWENRTTPRIRNLHGIFRYSDLIFSPDNLQYFHYQYLREQHFRQLRFVFLGSDQAKPHKADFVKRLNAARKATNLSAIEPECAEKITFITLGAEQAAQYGDQVRRFFQRSESEAAYDAYWSFDTRSVMRGSKMRDIPIGFVGRRAGYTDDVWNLSLTESFNKRSEFDEFWYAITKSAR
jgi:hypothetical protein